MIHSMTKEERDTPGVMNNSRRKRIAEGSGTKQDEVGGLVKQFEMVSKMTRQMASLSAKDRVAAVKSMGGEGVGMLPGMKGMPGLGSGRGSTHTASIKERFKKRKR
jgi:signal recognition particle subunit SRP54